MGLKLGRTAAIHFLSQVAVSLSGFIATFIIARILGAEGVGVYALGMSLAIWINIPLSGFQEALKKRVSEGIDQDEYFTAGAILNTLAVAIPALLVLAFTGPVNRYVGASIASLIAILLLTRSIFGTASQTLEGEKKVSYAGWTKFVERILRTAAQVVLLIFGYQVAGLFVGHAVALVVSSLLALPFISLRPAFPDRSHFERLVEYARYSWSTGLKGRAFNYTDIIVLGLFVSSTLVGIYRVAWTLASFLVVLSSSISSTLFPEISDISTRGKTDQVKHYLEEGLVFTGLFLIPGLFGAIALGNDLLRIYETEFTRGSGILVILIGARMVDSYASQITSVIRALDHPNIVFKIDLLFVGLNIGLNIPLVYLYGWYGAAVATLLSGSFTLVLSYVAISKLLGRLSIPLREIGEEVLASIIMFVSIILLQSVAPSAIPVTILLVGCGAVIYTGILLTISPRIRQKAVALVPPQILPF